MSHVPLCHCSFLGSAKLRVSKSDDNPNEEYYACMNRGTPHPACKFFVWVNQDTTIGFSSSLLSAPSTPKHMVAPAAMDLSLQVEELEMERDRFEDSAIRAQYELTLVTGIFYSLPPVLE
ncbi:hypothetical protein BS47DRAFT_1366886 [Hydnum rufescens UP504]|uniref:GRF-type domain-containing protein n=1 Tax=Hydnum rufescens UP504 TaxID=1448309 RepID=A0A9P6AJT5_9AGAM|nr:hypothetical protein BS47DRAFT_1366886 [Hydnum rufescens UP504]